MCALFNICNPSPLLLGVLANIAARCQLVLQLLQGASVINCPTGGIIVGSLALAMAVCSCSAASGVRAMVSMLACMVS